MSASEFPLNKQKTSFTEEDFYYSEAVFTLPANNRSINAGRNPILSNWVSTPDNNGLLPQNGPSLLPPFESYQMEQINNFEAHPGAFAQSSNRFASFMPTAYLEDLHMVSLLKQPAIERDMGSSCSTSISGAKPASSEEVLPENPLEYQFITETSLDYRYSPEPVSRDRKSSIFFHHPTQSPGKGHFPSSPNLTLSDSRDLPILMSQPDHAAIPKLKRGGDKAACHKDRLNLVSQSKATCENRSVRDGEEEFSKFVSLLSKVTPQNACVFLVGCLKEYHQHITLKELFDLLYNGKAVKCEIASISQGSNAQNSESREMKRKGLKLCHLVVDTFRELQYDKYMGVSPMGLTQISSRNFNELLRNFLAIKIIFASIERVEDKFSWDVCISKQSLYKVYCILCQKLIQRHSTSSSCTAKSITISPPKLGRLFNLVYPDLIQKRLGRRGHSKFHYIGVKWNNEIVDKDIIGLIDHFDGSFNSTKVELNPKCEQGGISQISCATEHSISRLIKKSLISNESLSFQKPSYSFIDFSHKFPQENCSPRVSNSTPNSIPALTEWAKLSIRKSLGILKGYNTDLECVLQNLNIDSFACESKESFPRTVLQTMTLLSGISAPRKAYMNFYLVLLLSIFPIIVASDQEVSLEKKISIRNSVRKCITVLESESQNLESNDATSLRSVLRIMKRMVALNEMTSSKVKSSYPERVLKEMAHDLDLTDNIKAEVFNTRSALEETCIQSIIMSMNAYDFSFSDESSTAEDKDSIPTISAFVQTHKRSMLLFKEKILSLPSYADKTDLNYLDQDVPYRVFKIAVEIFHGFTLRDPSVLKFPIPLLAIISFHITNSIQHASFNHFSKRDPELSKEIFKSWWIFSAMLQEYMAIISEIVALKDTLECI
ncbi:hypothetical protein JCM33374_g3062 [Metschnikowia sp. JCM 33374]|nr:hypothetical protein JCM33374_g3062 [Metschnikowia sp. JCM 33374]